MNQLLYCIAGLFGFGVLCVTMLAFAPGDHTNTIALVGTLVLTGTGFMVQHFKAQTVEGKLDRNTRITVDARETAAIAASAAVETAGGIKDAVNGRMQELLDARYAAGVVAGQNALRELQEQQHRHQQRTEEQIAKNLKALEAMKEAGEVKSAEQLKYIEELKAKIEAMQKGEG